MDVYQKAAMFDDGAQVQSAKLMLLDIIWNYHSNRKVSDGGQSAISTIKWPNWFNNAFEERVFP